jgi:NADH-quinone oxidoreductase subunit A
MSSLLANYLPILIFLAIAIAVAGAAVGASLIVARQNPDSEKLSPYECGFDAFDDARRRFDVRFYLVSLLFIIFDLEVAFLFPWAVSLGDIGVFGFWSMVVFLGVLTVGFAYEWKKGALEWDRCNRPEPPATRSWRSWARSSPTRASSSPRWTSS